MPPDDVLALIKLREGFVPETYPDSLGKLTAGWGHLLNANERETYPRGATVPEDVIENWFESDTAKAYAAAQKQAADIVEPQLVDALTSVIFQMGPAWNLPESEGGHGFVHTYAALKAHDWNAAISGVQNSAWNRETPLRVADFVAALRLLS